MTEELKHIDKAGTVENAEVVENTEVVESNDSKQSNKHWYVLRVMGGTIRVFLPSMAKVDFNKLETHFFGETKSPCGVLAQMLGFK